MMKHTTTLLLFACLLLAQAANAQNDIPCATDVLHQKALQNPVYFQKHQSLENEAYHFFLGRRRQAYGDQAGRGSQVLTIPVVVHIIHDNGPENISDAAVQQAIQWLNQAFANQGYYGQGSGADAGIQFCLAQRTPDGQATNGITRDQNALTEFTAESQEGAMKNINRWKPKDYINIWVVRDICSSTYGCGIVAYAYYPSFHGNNLDGLVVEAQLLASPANVSGLAHEMGHYFGLYHTFEGGCSNNDCLLSGDRVCDTPPDQSTAAVPCDQSVNTCTTDTQSGFATDHPDMIQNHMDYGHLDCKHDFTQGQADRMNFFLNGARKSLLDSKGCLPPCPLPTVAAFTPGDTTINAGQTLFFDNTSQNAVNFSWTLNGVPFGGQQNASYLFDSAGVFTVQLVAQPLNAQLCEASSAQVTVQVVCPAVADFTLSNLTPEEGQTVFITNNSQNATQYEWFVNGVSQGAVLDSIVFTESGSYDIRLVAMGSFCNGNAMQEVFVRDSCTSKTFVFNYDVLAGPFDWKPQSSTILTDGNLLITGVNNNSSLDFDSAQVIFIKMKPDGSILWTKFAGEFTGVVAECPAVAATSDGGFVALLYQFYYFPDTTGKTFLAKFSPDGTMEWMNKIFESISGSTGYDDLIIFPNDEILVDNRLKFDQNGALLWSKTHPLIDISMKNPPFPDGDFISVENKPNAFDFARFNANGDVLWSKKFDVDKIYILDVAIAPDSSILVLGRKGKLNPTTGPFHTMLLKFSPDGELLWSRRYFRTENYQFAPHAFALTDDGVTVVARSTVNFWPPSIKNYRAMLHVDYEGNIVWCRHFEDDNLYENLYTVPDGYIGISGFDWFKADVLGYAGECESIHYDIISEDVPATSTPISIIATAGPVDFPPDSLPVFDAQIALSPLDTICTPACPRGVELCNNNLDDDEDGLFDCLDPDCNCPEDVCKPGQANIWYFGDHSGLDFNTEPPTVLTDGQTMNDPGSAVMCDAKGSLLFYSDGKTIYNRFHEPMPNGSGLGTGNYEVVAIPYPGETELYYLFIVAINGAWYSLVDMKLDGGKGDIVADKKLIPLSNFGVFEPQLAVTKSCTFDGYWLVLRSAAVGTAPFKSFRIDENGLAQNPIYSDGGLYLISAYGQMKISPHGWYLVKTVAGTNLMELYDFNTTSGTVSGQRNLNTFQFGEPFGLEFSPNGRYLYCSIRDETSLTTKLLQLDLNAGNASQIIASAQVVVSTPMISPFEYCYGALQLAPNGKILVTNRDLLGISSPILHIIHQPNLPAPYCQFQEGGITLASTTAASSGLVNVPQSLFAKSAITFKSNAPDTICILDSLYTYTVEKSGCYSTDSIVWKMEGLSATLNYDHAYGWVTFDAPGEGQLISTAYSPCGIVSDTLHIVVTAPFDKTLDLGPDRTVCDNGVFTFNAGSGFARYRWQNGAPDSVLTTLLPGQYWVDVWDACGNQQSDTVTVSIAPATVLDLGDDQEGCDDLTATFQRPEFFSVWLWTPNEFISCDTCASVTVAPAATTSWIVVAQTDDGCISVDTVTFQVQDTLFFQLDTSVCFGQTIDLFGVSLPADTTAQFFFPASGPGCDTLLTVHVLGLDAPMTELVVQVCAGQLFDFNGSLLPADTTATFLFPGTGSACDSIVTVHVSAYPPLTVTLPPDTTLRIGAMLNLKAEISGTGVLNFAWSPADGLSCADCPDPEAAPLETTLYSILVADANGCSAQDSILVTVDPACVVIIPNAFTPNGDGVNDRFYPKTDPCVRNVRLWRVVSRWGETVFERFNMLPNDPALGWDGSRSNGEPFPSDVLVWYVELEYYDGRKEVRKGDVGLLR